MINRLSERFRERPCSQGVFGSKVEGQQTGLTGYSIKTLRYRYSEWGEDGGAGAELYDHQTDPHELKNLAADPRQKQRAQQLSRQLRQRIAAARKKLAGITQIQFENRRRVR